MAMQEVEGKYPAEFQIGDEQYNGLPVFVDNEDELEYWTEIFRKAHGLTAKPEASVEQDLCVV